MNEGELAFDRVKLSPVALAAAVMLVLAGCATSGTNYQAPPAGFAESLGCGTSPAAESASAAYDTRKPPEGTDACDVIAVRGVPTRVDRVRIGPTVYQNWLYRDLTIVVRNGDCLGGTCSEGSVWEVVYSG